jgi:hypothetical protein
LSVISSKELNATTNLSFTPYTSPRSIALAAFGRAFRSDFGYQH